MSVRTGRLAALISITILATVLAVPPALAATVVVSERTDPGETIGAEVQREVFALKLTGGGSWTGLRLDFAQVGDADFGVGDIAAGDAGIVVYQDNGTVADQLDPGDTDVSGEIVWTGLRADVAVSATIPEADASTFNFFVTITTSPTISNGDDFTITIPGGALCPGVKTSGGTVTLSCNTSTTDTITADTIAPTAQLSSTPTDVHGNVVWTFSEAVVGVTEDNVVLRRGGADIAADVTYDPTTRTATINPDAALAIDATYHTIVNPDGAAPVVTDRAGNPVGQTTANFTTADLGFTPGVRKGNLWLLNNSYDTAADITRRFGSSTDFPLVGDWDGDGLWTYGVRKGNFWFLSNNLDSDNGDPDDVPTFRYGSATDYPLVGDWDGDGDFTPGVVKGNQWFLNNGTDPNADEVFHYGSVNDFPVVGDWNGDRRFTIGVLKGNMWFLNNDLDPTNDVAPFGYGAATDFPVVGDWDGDGDSTPGVVKGNVWFLNNGFDPRNDIPHFGYGSASDFPLAGDWDGSISAASVAGSGLLDRFASAS